MATLQDVADRAGVSVRTVSNVVNDYLHVAPATRDRVQQAIDELGYRPNLAARQLRSGRTGMLALVVPEVSSPYFGELASAFTAAAGERGWTVLIDETRGDPERERLLLGRSGAHFVDGLVFSPWSVTPEQLTQRPSQIPLVLLGERGAAGRFDRVAVDSVRAAREATEHLIGLGRRRIAAIGLQPQLANNTARQRLTGYRAALRAAGLRRTAELEVPVRQLHRADGAAAMTGLLQLDPRPDAVFCFTDELALGANRVLADRGIGVPDDIALIGFDDIEDGRFSVPTLSTIAPDRQQIATVALDFLLSRLDDPTLPARELWAGHALVRRESTTPRR